MKFKNANDGREFEIEIIAREGTALRARIGGEEIAAAIEPGGDGSMIIRIGARAVRVFAARAREAIIAAAGPQQFEFAAIEENARRRARGLASPEIIAPMPGKVLRVLVAEGQAVAAGEPLLVLEAMKMETTLYAESDATVRKIAAAAGAMIDHGAVLLELNPPADSSASESALQDH
jgi:acetyl/propionyl-CoA carboxylase alpha subunit